jgi:galactokinase/mevalonate kinase-like predicted kinase
MQRIEHAMRHAGVWGVKASGAGAGGCLIAMCAPSSQVAVVSAAEDAGAEVLDVGFVSEGVRAWEEHDAAPVA